MEAEPNGFKSGEKWDCRAEETVCYVCHEGIQKQASKLPCGHGFHLVCLELSLFNSNRCPICRVTIAKGVMKKYY